METDKVDLKVSKLAITGFIVAILLFILPFLGLITIILGASALFIIAKYPGKLKGRGFAFTTVIIGLAQVIYSVALTALITIFMVNFVGLRSGFLSRERGWKNLGLESYLTMGDWFLHIGNTKKAAQYYEKAISRLILDPIKSGQVNYGEFILYHNLAVAQQLSGNIEASRQSYRRALKVANKSAGLCYYGLGASYTDAQEFEKALGPLDKAIEFNPELATAYQEKAAALRQLGRFEDSIAACQVTIAIFPKFAQAYSTMGLAYEKLGRFEEALRAYIEAIELNPRRHYPRDRLYYCFYKIRDNTEVVNGLIEKLMKIDVKLAGKIRYDLEKGVAARENSFDNLNKEGRGLYQGIEHPKQKLEENQESL